MKRAILCAAPVILALVFASQLRADDTKVKASEWTVTVGCAHCNFEDATKAADCAPAAKLADGKVVLLKGDAMKEVKYKKGGQYVVTGTMSEDGKSIDVATIKPKEA